MLMGFPCFAIALFSSRARVCVCCALRATSTGYIHCSLPFHCWVLCRRCDLDHHFMKLNAMFVYLFFYHQWCDRHSLSLYGRRVEKKKKIVTAMNWCYDGEFLFVFCCGLFWWQPNFNLNNIQMVCKCRTKQRNPNLSFLISGKCERWIEESRQTIVLSSTGYPGNFSKFVL